jgi:hypothetical protein
MQSWLKDSGQRVVVLFEGRDAAGKGGTIKRFTEHLNPRGARVVALEKPSERERTQWYFQTIFQSASRRRGDRAIRPVLVQPRRRRTRHGFLHPQRVPGVHGTDPWIGAGVGRQRHPPGEVMVLSLSGRTTDPVHHPGHRPATAVEAQPRRPAGLPVGAVGELDHTDIPLAGNVRRVEFTARGTGTRGQPFNQAVFLRLRIRFQVAGSSFSARSARAASAAYMRP